MLPNQRFSVVRESGLVAALERIEQRAVASSERGAILVQTAVMILGLLCFTSFIFDYGVLWVSRAQAQTAADAACLAGAIALGLDSADPEHADEAKARESAVYVASQNKVWAEPVVLQVGDVTFPDPCPGNTPSAGGSTCIRVDVFRNEARGNPLPIFFAYLMGVSAHGVRATATCGAGPDPWVLVIDEDAIDNGALPNLWTAQDVNDDDAALGLRTQLQWFAANPGVVITLPTGQPGDEGFFLIPTIQQSWIDTGPYTDGAMNYWVAGPGLGTGGNPEEFLDKVPDVDPQDATELAGLVGHSVCAVVPDGDVSMNFDPTTGSLKGSSLGVVAFEVLATVANGTGGSFPWLSVRVQDSASCGGVVSQDNHRIRLVR